MSRNQIQFYFRGSVHSVLPDSPTQTVLHYLRRQQGACGSKEGCGEGDCGACTVVVGDMHGDALQLSAVNACIQFLPALDGKALFTVEDLARGEQLHPLQQALVDCHGSQCGFCTPGIVMSLWAQQESQPGCPSRSQLQDALSGNLCRCTGYRPILDAAQQAASLPAMPLQREPVLAVLQQLAARPSLQGEAGGARYAVPATLDELLALRRDWPQARLVAGSTDVGLWVTKQLRTLGDVIFVGRVPELRQLQRQADGVWIGAAVSVEDALQQLAASHPAWDALRLRFASRPVRNAGTLGGNVANGSPIGDSMPALIAAGARVVLQSLRGRRELALEDFYLGYQRTALAADEIVLGLCVPPLAAGSQLALYKVSKRFDQDISAVFAAVQLQVADGRIAAVRLAFGGMAATPARAPHAEAALQGAAFDAASFAAAGAALAQDFSPLSDVRGSAAYRLQVAAGLLQRAWLQFSGHAATDLARLEASA